jgi:organic radical activating enzyme
MDHNFQSRDCSLKGQDKVFNLFTGTVNSCCRAYPEKLSNFDSVNTLITKWDLEKKSLQQGKKIPGCNHCWKHEDSGVLSYRQQQGINDTRNCIELIFSNACNQMCSYCSPKFSTTWQESIRTHGLFERVSRTTNLNLAIPSAPSAGEWLNKIQHYISQCDDNSVYLKLLGGEPLMQKANLEKFLQLQNSKIRKLTVVTNLNPPDNKFLSWLLDHYDISKLNFSISLDATPEFNHVPRAGFDCDKFYLNLELLKQRQVKFKLMSVVSALNIFDLHNFLPWIQDNRYCIDGFYRVNNPPPLDPAVVPAEFRSQVFDLIDKNLLPEHVGVILQEPDSLVDLKLREQYNYLKQYFERTAIDPNKVDNKLFVDYWTWLTWKFT